MASEKETCTLSIVGVVLLFSSLAGKALGNDFLDIKDIRLENGTGHYGGRVEVSINGVWGTVCDDWFEMNVATVMCGMMNLLATGYAPGAFHGQGTGPIFAQWFYCNGNESHIKDCRFQSNVQCTHARDISIFCTECGEIEIEGGYIKSISQNGSVLSAACKQGHSGIDFETSVCAVGTWSMPSISCEPDIKGIRLANGVGLFDGRVEIMINGVWGTICGISSSWQEAWTICEVLFGSNSWSQRIYTTSNVYGAGAGPIGAFDCDGREPYLSHCTFSRDVSCKDHGNDFAVSCNVFPLNITDSRLINGTGPYDGRIEFYVDGHWGTINGGYFDMTLYDAKTICNTHGASLAMYFDTAKYGQGTGPILAGNIYCYRERQHINNCSINAPYGTQSYHEHDLSIACTPCGVPPIYNGDPVAFSGNELTVRCQTGFSPNQVTMKCLANNTWSQEQMCTPNYGFPLNIIDIRLFYGERPSEGRVEIMVNGVWGTVCDTNFDSNDATVICKMFGLQYYNHYLKAEHHSGRGSGPIYVSNLSCAGTESHINNCSYDISNNCTHYDDVAVECTGRKFEGCEGI